MKKLFQVIAFLLFPAALTAFAQNAANPVVIGEAVHIGLPEAAPDPSILSDKQPDPLETAIDNFLRTRCAGFEVLSSGTKLSTREVGFGVEDTIYTRAYNIRRLDGAQDDLSIKVVNTFEGAWYVYGGEGGACDFTQLPYYSE
jgi:hypothetical protein